MGNRNFKDAVGIILRLYRLEAMPGHTRRSPESYSSTVMSSSLHYDLKQSSLSSVKTPLRKERSRSSHSRKWRTSQPRTRGMVENGYQSCASEKSVADQETTHSATSSIFATFTSGSERAPKVKKRYKLKKQFGRRKSESKESSFSAERMHGVGQIDLTPKIREVAFKKFVGGDAKVFQYEN